MQFIEKKTKNVLLICREESSLENLLPIGKLLKELSRGQVNYSIVPLDEFYFQGLEKILEKERIPYVKVNFYNTPKKPIPFLNLIEEFFIYYFRNYKRVAQFVKEFDAIVITGYNIPERMFVLAAETQGKPIFFIFPGNLLLKRKDLKHTILTAIMGIIRKTLGLLGVDLFRKPRWKLSKGDYQIFVAGECDKKILIEQGETPNRIVACGIPRYKRLFTKKRADIFSTRQKEKIFKILYITGSFLWHRDKEGHKIQQEQLREICEIIKAMDTNYQLIVKLHPRENEKYYNWLKNCERVTLCKKNVYELIENSNLILSIISSCIFEAILLDRLTISVSFPRDPISFYPDFPRFSIPVIKTPDELKQLILKVSSNQDIYIQLLEKEKEAVYEFIAPQTPFSAEIITKEILKKILV